MRRCKAKIMLLGSLQQDDVVVKSNRRLMKRFLFACVIISLFLLPGLIWPFAVLKRLPSDVRIGIPFFVVAFGLTFALGAGIFAYLKTLPAKSGMPGKVFEKVLISRQTFMMLVLVLVHLFVICITGLAWVNLRLLFVENLGKLPIWSWSFASALLAVLMMIIIGTGSFSEERLRYPRSVEALERLFNRKNVLGILSFVLSALTGLGLAQLIVLYFRSYGASFSNMNIQIILSFILPFVIYDLTFLASILYGKWVSWHSHIESAHSWKRPVNRIQDFVLLHPLLASLFCTGSLFLFCFAIFRVGYGVNDDIQIISVASGYLGGKPFPFLIFSNVILGFALNFLYHFPTHINWEICFFIVVHFTSVWALIDIVLSRSLVKWKAQAINLLIISSGEIYFLLNITFTTVAAVASIAGFCLILTAIRSDSNRVKWPFIWGGGLIFVASLIRFESFEFVSIIIAPFLVVNLRILNLKNLVMSLGIIGLLVFGTYAFDKFYLRLFPDWLSYDKYTMTRSLLHDTPRLANIDGAIRNINWSTNDLNMFSRWFFPDSTTYSLGNLKYLVDHVSDKNKNILSWIFFLPDYLSNLVTLPFAIMSVGLWLSMVLRGADTKKTLLVSIFTIVLILSILIYLDWRNKAPDRIVLFSIWAAIIFSLMNWYWVDAKMIAESIARTLPDDLVRFGNLSLIVSLAMMIGVTVQQSIEITRSNISRQAAYDQIISDIQTLQSKGTISHNALIVSAAYGIPWEWSNPLFLDFPSFQYLPTNWETFSPAYDKALHEFNIQSLPVSLYQNGNVYLMVDTSTMRGVIQFIKEHEGVDVAAKVIYVIPSRYSKGTVYDGVALFKLQPAP